MLLIRMVAGFSFLLTFLLQPFPAIAQVSGLCSNCHTMHNSQDGKAVLEGGGPLKTLLKNDCVGCHSSTGNLTIDTSIGSAVPIVFNHNEPTYPPNGTDASTLAGGNFYWVANKGDAFGHNVLGISEPDKDLTERAPGNIAGSCVDCHISLATPATLTGAENGCKGCHVPRHHAEDSEVVVGKTGGWYRFLGVNTFKLQLMDAVDTGVIGIEAEDWEQNPSETNHNVYQGTTNVYGQVYGQYIQDNSIGSFCAGCHGQFHHEMNSNQPSDVSGAWLRHPSDVVIPIIEEGEEGAVYNSGGTYNPMVPVAKGSPLTGLPSDITVVSSGSDVVTCLSCHRAHGSPYPDMLRWDYQTDCKTGMPNDDCGCFSCHSAKDY